MKTFLAQLSLIYCLQFSDDDPFMIELTLPSLLRIEDPNERASLEAQILEFGQTPKQLFTSPHPQKLVKFYQSHVRVNFSKKHHVSFSSIYISKTRSRASLPLWCRSINWSRKYFLCFQATRVYLHILYEVAINIHSPTNQTPLTFQYSPPQPIASTLHQVSSFRENLRLSSDRENHPSEKSPTMKTESTCFAKSLRR